MLRAPDRDGCSTRAGLTAPRRMTPRCEAAGPCSDGRSLCRASPSQEDTMVQSHLVIDFPIDGPGGAAALREELPPLMPDLARAQDDLGTVHFSRFNVGGRREAALPLRHRW